MKEYHKINSVYKRDEKGKFLLGQWSTPEIEYLKDLPWIWTEKVDGTNIRVIWDGEKVKFNGKTDNAQIYSKLTEKLIELFPSDKFKIKDKPPMCLYGEGYGAKIQKGGGNYISDGVGFVLFDVLVDKWWLKRESCIEIAEEFNIHIVPVIGKGTLNDAIEMTRNGFKSRWGDFLAEGIVMKPKVDLWNRKGERIITKIKHKDFNFI